MKLDTSKLIGAIKKDRLIELMKDVVLPEEMEREAERLLEIPNSGIIGEMTQEEADLISEPKD